MPGIARAISAPALKKSILLPQTTFPMRANAATRELLHVDRLTTSLYRRQAAGRRAAEVAGAAPPPFVLHDGPPYANGSLHIGHFMNKVLKDILNRRALLSGRRVDFVPGWDCHGLPIELKALQSIRSASANTPAPPSAASAPSASPQPSMSPLEIRALARAFAEEAIAGQCADFKRWGVLADWDLGSRSIRGNAYVTMDARYEAAQLRVFASLLRRGFVHRALKPVFWSPSSGTALAEAELEYEEKHVSRAAYVAFPFAGPGAAAAGPALAALAEKAQAGAAAGAADFGRLAAVAWTTTPWTLPANVALAVHPDLQYSVVALPVEAGDLAAEGLRRLGLQATHLLVQSDRVADLARALGAAAAKAKAAAAPASAAGAAAGGAAASGKAGTSSGKSQLPAPEPLHLDLPVVATFAGRDIAGALFAHPLGAALPPVPELAVAAGSSAAAVRVSPLITAPYVTADSGTGIVHTAPGHGHDDFSAASAHNAALDSAAAAAVAPGTAAAAATASPLPRLPVLCPVDGAGRFTAEAGASLAGLPVLEGGNAAVLSQLGAAGALLASEKYVHRYPCDWRTKQPVIIRATQQWFVRLGAGLTVECKTALGDVAMVPAQARNRFEAMVGSRSEWCISRQRCWGVPIPALFDEATGEALMTPQSVAHIAAVFEREGGSDAWWRLPAEAFLPPDVAAAAAAAGRRFVKGSDTLDVWFDSGSSWAAAWAHGDSTSTASAGGTAVQAKAQAHGLFDESAPAGAAAPGRVSDVVLEGSDQHRGWFQSSLITGVAATGNAPYREIVTHGFVLDEQGRKMSKSLGNVIAPTDIIEGRKGIAASKAGAPGTGAAAAGAASAAAAAAAAEPDGGKGKGKGQGQGKGGKGQGKGASAAAASSAAATLFDSGHGVDVLRWWVASADFTRDTAIGPVVLATVVEAVRKIRNSARFLLGNLHDYAPPMATSELNRYVLSPASPSPSPPVLETALLSIWSAPPAFPEALMRQSSEPWAETGAGAGPSFVLERCLLDRLAGLTRDVDAAYARRDFHAAAAAVNAFVAVDLSSQYFDFCKDRLYLDLPHTLRGDSHGHGLRQKDELAAGSAASSVLGVKRQVSQAVLWQVLRSLTLCIAPVLPFMAEEIFQHSAQLARNAIAAAAPVSEKAHATAGAAAADSASADANADEDVQVPGVTLFDARFDLHDALDGASAFVPVPPASSSSSSSSSAKTSSQMQVTSQAVSRWRDARAQGDWTTLLALRYEVNRCLEAARAAKRIGSALEAAVTLRVRPGGQLVDLLTRMAAGGELEDLLLTSHVRLEVVAAAHPTQQAAVASSGEAAQAPALTAGPDGSWRSALTAQVPVFLPGSGSAAHASSASAAAGESLSPATAAATASEGIVIEAAPAAGAKCARCWKVKPEVAAHASHLCTRCDSVVDALGLWDGAASGSAAGGSKAS